MEFKKYHGIGLMSGTSLDGLDLAYSIYTFKDRWNFELIAAKTYHYDIDFKSALQQAHTFSAAQLMAFDAALAHLFAHHINSFNDEFSIEPEFISSHGHTIFHQPFNKQHDDFLKSTIANKPFTTQIGSGAILSALTGIDVICDFRSADVALGGQGAPLVPIGDSLLFNQYDYCLNLGGIANISFEVTDLNKQKSRIASDLCFANMGLNYLASTIGLDYDADGKRAAAGNVNHPLLDKLNALEFHQQPFPKSIGKEYFETAVQPLLDEAALTTNDLLRTFCEHIMLQVKSNLKAVQKPLPTLFITGGGVHNTFLMELFKQNLPATLILPSKEIIDFKEAILFGFLGVLRLLGESNTLSSVTGASRNACSGAVYKGQ
jgi:anhydro-N-acetylmuramic acid kinase